MAWVSLFFFVLVIDIVIQMLVNAGLFLAELFLLFLMAKFLYPYVLFLGPPAAGFLVGNILAWQKKEAPNLVVVAMALVAWWVRNLVQSLFGWGDAPVDWTSLLSLGLYLGAVYASLLWTKKRQDSQEKVSYWKN